MERLGLKEFPYRCPFCGAPACEFDPTCTYFPFECGLALFPLDSLREKWENWEVLDGCKRPHGGMADALDSKSSIERCGGSTPLAGI